MKEVLSKQGMKFEGVSECLTKGASEKDIVYSAL
jgi:hypothetical protein